ncbi:hypothetical protein [Enterocloster bolteae]|uniref:hypothetical protein n=1 Tax=Enterocloster bolteae TaxID=208479 RepID=UPI001FF4110E|nr:hypothetical protein [Enterocloster bolteae]UOX69921.1 hypothetical protein K4205_26845 [Enterocloster bolteae]
MIQKYMDVFKLAIANRRSDEDDGKYDWLDETGVEDSKTRWFYAMVAMFFMMEYMRISGQEKQYSFK